MEPMGSKLLLTIKSSKSKMEVPGPIGWKPLNKLKPKAQGRDNRMISTIFTNTLFFLLQWNRSIPNDTIFSNTAIIVVKAAKVINRKNSAPHIRPPGMELKIFGKVTNTSLGPLPTSTLNAEQAGKMIKPAIKATKVSKRVIWQASPVKLRSFPI